MDLITSASSEMYQQAFSPGLRRTAGSVTATDVLILVLIAVLIVYLLARTFQGQCRTVCHQVCPMDGTEHMSGTIPGGGTACGDHEAPQGIFGSGFSLVQCTKFQIAYTDLAGGTHADENALSLEEGADCITFDEPLNVKQLSVSTLPIANNCNVSSVKVWLINDNYNPSNDPGIGKTSEQAQNIVAVTDENINELDENLLDYLHESDGIKYWKIKKIYIVGTA